LIQVGSLPVLAVSQRETLSHIVPLPAPPANAPVVDTTK
jgi:hypothetical protein